MTAMPRVGLLGLYLKLYDDAIPDARPRMNSFYDTVATELQRRGLDVVRRPLCRVASEFKDAVQSFEREGCDCIVTLHLAYSPSLESADALSKTRLPVIVLDTTPAFSYGPDQDPDELMYNHGIHGVQDLCNVLLRKGKPYALEVGHWQQSDVLDRVASRAAAARLVTLMRSAKVGLIGDPFEGMGDFLVLPDALRQTIGIEVVAADPSVIRSFQPEDDDPEVDAELEADRHRFVADNVDPSAHRNSVRSGLAVRRWVEEAGLAAFTVNFMSVDRRSGLPTVPFLEASKAMSRGIGYAGEGDVLTAALVGVLVTAYPDTTFTEMFCPDWDSNSIYVSHMGEFNVSLAADTPVLRELDFPWTDAENPVIAVSRLRGGRAVLVDLAPGPMDSYTLVLARVVMLDVEGEDRMRDSIHGWFTPEMPIADFLEAYSSVGGTHHAALVYEDVADDLMKFGEMMGWDVAMIG